MSAAMPRFSAPVSALEGVSPDAWRRFVAALEVQAVNEVSPKGALGAYAIRARRMVELGYATRLRTERRDGVQRQVCAFILPWTEMRFLKDPLAQYTVLVKSMRAYYAALTSGELKVSEGLSKAGALAILHIGGKGALTGWPKLFDNTRAVYERAQGEF